MLDDHAKRETTDVAPNAGALTVAPRDLRSAEPNLNGKDATPERREPTLQTALTLDEDDAERVAFAMWREGRADEAIAFLEREILLERDRQWKRETFSGRHEPYFGDPTPDVIVPPPPAEETKPKRRRKKRGAPVSEPSFSDASAPLIELSAETVDVTPEVSQSETGPGFAGRIGRGPAIVAAIGLVVVGFAALGNIIWDSSRPAGEPEQTALAVASEAAQPVVPEANPEPTADETASQLVVPQPAAEPKDVASATPAAPVTPSLPETSTSTPPPVNAALLVLPEEDDGALASAAPPREPDIAATQADSASMQPPVAAMEPSTASGPAVAEGPALALGDPAETLDDSVTPPPPEDFVDEAALDDSVTPPPPDEVYEAALLQPEPVVARLPRERPEPPAGVIFAPRPTVASTAPNVAPSPPVYLPPEPQPQVAEMPLPLYDQDGLPQQRRTLTPAEYQALLARRGAANDYPGEPGEYVVLGRVSEGPAPVGRPMLLRLLRR